MDIEFIKPLYVNQEAILIGAIEKTKSERRILATGEIYSKEGVLCTKAHGEYAVMPVEVAVRLGIMSEEYTRRFLCTEHIEESRAENRR